MATTVCGAFMSDVPEVCSRINKIPGNSLDNTLIHRQKTDTEKFSNEGLFSFVVVAVIIFILLVFMCKGCWANKMNKFFRRTFTREVKRYTEIQIRSKRNRD